MNYFFSGDHHFSHQNIIKYCKRPFSIQDHDAELIKRWNEKISNNDSVYYVGDFCFGRVDFFLDQLNFKQLFWVLGNHDDRSLTRPNYVKSKNRDIVCFSGIHEIKLNDFNITLCHFAMRKWNKSHFGAWHLFGHSHGRLAPYGLSFDVGVDGNDYYPVSFDEVKAFMNKQLKTCPNEELGLVKEITSFV